MGGCRSTLPPRTRRRTREDLLLNSVLLQEKDKGGRLPQYLTAAFGPSDVVVAALLLAYPEAAKEKGWEGNLPLHYAAGYGASDAVVAQLY